MRKGWNMTNRLIILLIVSIAFINQSLAQSKTIEGVVIDGKTKQPLPFATVGVRGTLVGTASNSDGKFIISIPAQLADSVIVCSYMGYKSFVISVKSATSEIEISLDQDTFTLDEVEVRPWEPWEYIRNALQKIPENYPEDAYMAEGYYTEYMSENGVFLKYTEGVVQTYNPSYESDTKNQAKVLKARRREDLGTLQFMKDKLEKKYEKELKKAKKKGREVEEKESLDEQIISASFGGPEMILSADPLRDTASFLDPRYKKKYKYFIDGYTRYQGEQVIIIGYESKGIYEHQRQSGKIYISLISDAIISMEHYSEIVIPGIARPVILVMGFGIKNPEITGKINFKPINGKWYLSDISFEGGTKLTKKKMFKKNDRSDFYIEISLINNQFNLNDVSEIPEEERIDSGKPLEEQVDPDPEFWKNYQAARQSAYFE